MFDALIDILIGAFAGRRWGCLMALIGALLALVVLAILVSL